MNERIKELVRQTGYILDSDKFKTGMPVEDEFVEKFAELIINKCLNSANEIQEMFSEAEQRVDDPVVKHQHAVAAHACLMIKNKIELTFGIEE